MMDTLGSYAAPNRVFSQLITYINQLRDFCGKRQQSFDVSSQRRKVQHSRFSLEFLLAPVRRSGRK
jgi:hypothetical protein